MTKSGGALLLGISLLLPASPSDAAYCGQWAWRNACRAWPAEDCVRQRYCRYWMRGEPRVYGYERRAERDRDDEPPKAHCQFDQPRMTATGDDKLEEDRARLSAQERWQINVGNRRGGRFSDIRFAAQATADCIQVVPSSLTERAQATIGIRHWVCTFEAVPCAAPKIPQDEDTRAKRTLERRTDPPARVEYYEAPPPPKRRWWRREER